MFAASKREMEKRIKRIATARDAEPMFWGFEPLPSVTGASWLRQRGDTVWTRQGQTRVMNSDNRCRGSWLCYGLDEPAVEAYILHRHR